MFSDQYNQLAAAYADKYTTAEPPLLQEVAAYTQQHHPEHHMLSGAVQGRLLQMISSMMAPRRILEVGTFTGYSALCLAEGLTPDGQLHTLELRPETAAIAQAFFNKSTQAEQIILHTGNALDIIAGLNEQWDLAFIDADKPGYSAYYELILPKMRRGGIIIADNVLFHGQVLEEPVKGKNAVAIQAFNEKVSGDTRVNQVLLTVRDGLMVMQKK